MVKPPKTMQPEYMEKFLIVNNGNNNDNNGNNGKRKANLHRGMEEDSFRHYMSRKISMQRKQFGIQLPPPPSPPTVMKSPSTSSNSKHRQVYFHPCKDSNSSSTTTITNNNGNEIQDMKSLIQRLQQRHGNRRTRQKNSTSPSSSTSSSQMVSKTHLFLRDVVLLINGYTQPDNISLQRMVQRYGGDMETYETTRVTHIIASQLSMAKTNVYRKRKRPIPIVRPEWIVDCVHQQKLLSHGPYLLLQQGTSTTSIQSVATFCIKNTTQQKQQHIQQHQEKRVSFQQSSLSTGHPHEHYPSHPFKETAVTTNELMPMDSILTTNVEDSSMDCVVTGLYTQLPENCCNISSPESTISEPTIYNSLEIGNNTTNPSSRSVLDQSYPSDLLETPQNIHDTNLNTLESLPCKALLFSDDHFEAKYQQLDLTQHCEQQTPDFESPDPNEIIKEADCHEPHDQGIQDEISNRQESWDTSFVPSSLSPILQAESKPNTGTAHELCNIKSKEDIPNPISDHMVALDSFNGQCEHNGNQLNERTDSKYINGRLRTTATDPNFLESFFQNSRLSFIGSYKSRTRMSPPTIKSISSQHPTINPHVQDLSSTFCRFILHVDMDSFFAAVVLRNYPQYRDTHPVAISHLGSKNGAVHENTINQYSNSNKNASSSECATCNYEARKYGVKKGMFLGRARELCPSLIVLPYDFEGYEEVSEQVTDILHQYANLYHGIVEQVSCDESYVELNVPMSDKDDTIEIMKKIADSIREDIVSTTDCTATIGVGINKFLAKVATSKVKPNGSHVGTDFRELLMSLKLRDLPGIGHRTELKLTSEGLITVQDIWDLTDERAEGELCRILGLATGKKIFGFCHGVDDRPVQSVARKTIGAECNYGVRFDGPYGVDHFLQGLAQEVETRMSDANIWGSKLTLKVKQRKADAPPPPKFLGHGSCHSMSRSIDLPGGLPSRDGKLFAKLALQLFQEMGVDVQDVRGMGIIISKLSTEITETSNRELSSWFQPKITNVMTDGNDTIPVADEVRNSDEEENKSKFEKQDLKSPIMKENHDHDDTLVDDFVLPPPSQIHMSQVMALPSPLKRKITKQLENRAKQTMNEYDESFLPNSENSHQRIVHVKQPLKQASVKSLFTLAAVKAGQQSLCQSLGENVSLTQLECLPFHLQLEIANGQNYKHDSSMRPMSSKVQPKALFRSNPSRTTPGSLPRESDTPIHCTTDKSHFETKEDDIEKKDPPMFLPSQSRRALFREDILPLQIFLNDNSPKDDTARWSVVQFLQICINEGRWYDVIILLRSIHNRTDDWGEIAYVEILEKVDQLFRQTLGSDDTICYRGLDRKRLNL